MPQGPQTFSLLDAILILLWFPFDLTWACRAAAAFLEPAVIRVAAARPARVPARPLTPFRTVCTVLA